VLEVKSVLSLHFLFPTSLPRLLQPRRPGKWPPTTTTLSNRYIYHQLKAWKCCHEEKISIRLIADVLPWRVSLNTKSAPNQLPCLASHWLTNHLTLRINFINRFWGFKRCSAANVKLCCVLLHCAKSPWSIGNVFKPESQSPKSAFCCTSPQCTKSFTYKDCQSHGT
jgi:hypothetical protein